MLLFRTYYNKYDIFSYRKYSIKSMKIIIFMMMRIWHLYCSCHSYFTIMVTMGSFSPLSWLFFSLITLTYCKSALLCCICWSSYQTKPCANWSILPTKYLRTIKSSTSHRYSLPPALIFRAQRILLQSIWPGTLSP